jgi:hypothetical protein
MQTWHKVNKAAVEPIIKATFPDYRGRKISVTAAISVTVHHADLNWSGGSRTQYRGCTTSGYVTGSLDKHNASAPWDKAPGSTIVELPAGAVLVEHVMFCGKDCGLRIYINPADMPKWIKAA